MYKIAIVEDNPQDSGRLVSFLARYESENCVAFQLSIENSSLAFLEHYQASYDVIFLDIEMPDMNGMEMAHRIRALDENVCLIFTTGLAQYAVEGYEVRALDYILKPVEYPNFALKLRRALNIREQFSGRELLISRSNGMQRLRIDSIQYIEVLNHTLYYHTGSQTFEERGSISEREKELSPYGFARCSASFLLNLRFVTSVSGNEVRLGSSKFTMSRTKRKDFLSRLTDYLGENNL